MFAIIGVGGKQYLVEKGDIIEIERQKEAKGEEIVLGNVLLIAEKSNIQIGKPYIRGAKVNALLLRELKASKVISHKTRARKSWHWRKGHRQILSRIQIKDF